jgi:hypothetical protein
MLENIILWLIIAAAAIYCGHRAYRTLSGKSRGCGCSCDPTEPTPQQIIPDITDQEDESDK